LKEKVRKQKMGKTAAFVMPTKKKTAKRANRNEKEVSDWSD
jgi:hypothetical protein